MSAESEKTLVPFIEPRIVDEDDFERFLIEKRIPFECIMCKGEIQIIQNANNLIPADLSIDFPPDIEKSSFAYTFKTRCRNCGNLQSYDRSEVFRWKTRSI